jgi:hypothetical protein
MNTPENTKDPEIPILAAVNPVRIFPEKVPRVLTV